MAIVLIDRLVHLATVIRITSNRYRVRSLLATEPVVQDPDSTGFAHGLLTL